MSALRVMVDGKPAWLIQEPAAAQLEGVGGRLVVGTIAAERHREAVAAWKARQAK